MELGEKHSPEKTLVELRSFIPHRHTESLLCARSFAKNTGVKERGSTSLL